MATVLGVLFICFLGPASATYCTFSSDCYGYLESCCSDGICRENCYYCSYDSQCGTGECCNSNGDCKTSCSSVTGGAIAGIIVSLVFVSHYCFYRCLLLLCLLPVVSPSPPGSSGRRCTGTPIHCDHNYNTGDTANCPAPATRGILPTT